MKVFVKSGLKYIKIETEEIFYIKAEGDYTAIHFKDHRLIILSTMNNAIKKLNLIQIHRSYAINLINVNKIETKSVVMANDKELSLSRMYRNNLLTRLSTLI